VARSAQAVLLPGAAGRGQVLNRLGVDCVTLANNHALDFGAEALVDTFEHLGTAGIKCVGAGRNLEDARKPAVLEVDGFRLAVLGFSDHPREFAAEQDAPGIGYADLRHGPDWLLAAIVAIDADTVLVSRTGGRT
jgi:poly-gamma-glutamate capsule biosynthesis protein CapA/YwtB (metallophosphatase superfamily)